MYYLDPSFEPKKLTKAELRSILAAHNVASMPHPSAKKDELLDVFYKEIVAKKSSILERQRSVKADAAGIVFLDEASRPSPRKPKTTPKKQDSPALSKKQDKARDAAPSKVEPPPTPRLMATYKLASRLEQLDSSHLAATRRSSVNVFARFMQVIAAASCILYMYLRFGHGWAVFSNEELAKMSRRPLLYLRCPYQPNSSIGYCANGRLYCSTGYVEKRHWLAFGSYCAIDRERLTLLDSIKKRIELELGTQLGLSECYGVQEQGVSTSALHDLIQRQFQSLKPKTFKEYFDLSLKALVQEGHVLSESLTSSEIIYRAKKPIFSAYCRLKLATRSFVLERPVECVTVTVLLLSSLIVLLRSFLKRTRANELHHYYMLVCKALKDQAAAHLRDPTRPSILSINQLRDAIFINHSQSKRRNSIWAKVIEKVARNSNIVESVTTLRGEQTRVWEWIGADLEI